MSRQPLRHVNRHVTPTAVSRRQPLSHANRLAVCCHLLITSIASMPNVVSRHFCCVTPIRCAATPTAAPRQKTVSRQFLCHLCRGSCAMPVVVSHQSLHHANGSLTPAIGPWKKEKKDKSAIVWVQAHPLPPPPSTTHTHIYPPTQSANTHTQPATHPPTHT